MRRARRRSASVATIASPTGRPSTNRKNSAAKLQKAKIAPTLRSMPPEMRLKRHAERDEAEFGEQPHQRHCVAERAVVRDGQREIDREPDHHRERDDRLEPLLEQQLGQEQPRRERMSTAARPRLGACNAVVDIGLHSAPRSAPAVKAGAVISIDGGRLCVSSMPSRSAASAPRSSWRRWRWSYRARSDACSTPCASFPGFVAAFQQRLRREDSVVTLLGRLVAQELIEVPLLTWSQSSCEPSPEA